MWMILKAELRYYYNTPLIITACIIVLLFIVIPISGESSLEKELSGFMTIAMFITGVSWYDMLTDKYKSKRVRMHAVLPVSGRLVGISRILIVVIFWTLTAMSLCLTIIILRPEIQAGDIFWKYISFTGVILFLNTNYTISVDLCNFITRKFTLFGIYNDRLTAIIFPRLIVFLLLLYVISDFSMPLRTHIVKFIFLPSGALLFIGIGCIMLYLSAAVYVRRRSFFV